MVKKPNPFLPFVVLGMCLLFIFSYHHSHPTHALVAARLEKTIPALEKNHITAFRYQDWCKVLEYNSQSFASNDAVTCTYPLSDTSAPEFTPEATQLLESVHQVVKSTGVKVIIIDDITYRGNSLASAEFHLDSGFVRHSFVYQPNYTTLPPDEKGEIRHEAINEDWYFVSQDWN